MSGYVKIKKKIGDNMQVGDDLKAYSLTEVNARNKAHGKPPLKNNGYYCTICGYLNDPFRYKTEKMKRLFHKNVCDKCEKARSRQQSMGNI